MPKYYCDYCDVYLTHDSSSVRKAHNNGKNHIMNVRNYYAELGQDKAQAIIDEITKAYERAGQSGFPPQYGYIPGIPTANPVVPGAAAPQFGGAPAPIMLSRPPTGTGAPGTIPAPGLQAPPPGIGSAPPGIGVGGPPSNVETEPGYSPMKIDPTSPGIRPPIVSPTNATSLGMNPPMLSNQQYGAPTGYMRPSGSNSQGPYPTTQGPPGSQASGGAPPVSVPPPGGANYQQYPGGHSQHYPPVTNSSGSLPPQPSRGVKRQMEE